MSRIYKWLILPVLIIVLVFFLMSNQSEDHQVVVILKNQYLTEYWRELKNGILKSQESHNVVVTFLAAESESDIEGQVRLIDQAIELKPDAIMLAANDYNGLMDSAEAIVDAGIKLVIIDSGINYDAYDSFVATDNKIGGYKAGSQLATLLPEGSKIAIINYSVGSQTAIERERGAIQALEDSGMNYDVQVYYCYDQVEEAMRITLNLLEESVAYKGIISLNETSSVGVARALEQSGQSAAISLVAYDSSHEELDYLEQGVIDALVVQKPFNMGYIGLETTMDLIDGVKVKKNIDTGSTLITIDNMFDKENIDLLFPFEE